MNNKIPKDIILTWKTKNIPSYVIENIKKIYPDFNVIFFDDEDCRKFISENYNQALVDLFDSLRRGYNKGDLFRYCYLYKCGGYYFDIDIEHVSSVENIIKPEAKLFSVISAVLVSHEGKPYPQIFQAVLCCEPYHPVIQSCISDMIKFGNDSELEIPPFTGSTTHRMFLNMMNYTKSIPRYGMNKNIQLGVEKFENNRYHCAYGDQTICFSRYINYNREEGFSDIRN